MNNVSNRLVLATHSQTGVVISFGWNEGQENTADSFRSKRLEYSDGIVLESVNKAEGVLFKDGATTFVNNEIVYIISKCFDNNPSIFDLIAEAEEPEQALISRYVLEA